MRTRRRQTLKNIIKVLLPLLLILAVPAGLILSSSRFVHIKGQLYYWDHTHFLRDSWKMIQGARCRFDPDGRLHEGWFKENEKEYYLISGIPVTGPYTVGKGDYYFDKNGIMQTGMIDQDGIIFFYGENGTKKTGWVEYSGSTYYFDKNGMKTGWLQKGHSRYYFRKNGQMQTGWGKIKGLLYNFADNGKMRSFRWYKDKSGTYYLCKEGHAVSGRTKINGTTYFFSDQYRLLKNTWVGNSYAGSDGSLTTSRSIDGLWVDEQGNKIYYGAYGSGGSLYIPTIGIEVPAYLTPGGKKGQEITDREYSAAYLTSFNKPVIADHNNQGFDRIKSAVPGSTRAFLLTEDTVTEYVCTDLFAGSNSEHDILDSRGTSIDHYKADLCLYTCNENWRHVTIVLFKKL